MNFFAPPRRSQGPLGATGLDWALQTARAEAAALPPEKRNWLPLDGASRRQPRASPMTSNNDNVARQGRDPPPGLPFNRNIRHRSDTVATSPAATEIMLGTAPLDMPERQREIQSSLFKMLGQEQ